MLTSTRWHAVGAARSVGGTRSCLHDALRISTSTIRGTSQTSARARDHQAPGSDWTPQDAAGGRCARSVTSGQAPGVARTIPGRRAQRRGRMPSTIETWAGNRASRPEAVLRPAAEEQVADIPAEATANGRRMKPVGASPSWSGAQLTDGVLLRLDQMQGVRAVDAEAGTIRVHAGTRLKDLMQLLGARGLSLPVRGSIAEQSIAGATATGTHGSAPGQGCLSTLVTALRLVTPDGMVHVICSDDTDPVSGSVRRGPSRPRCARRHHRDDAAGRAGLRAARGGRGVRRA